MGNGISIVVDVSDLSRIDALVGRLSAFDAAELMTGGRLTDTLLRFELHTPNGGPDTTLDFRHSGWDETSPYLGFCNHQWGIALQALRRHCEQHAG